MGAFDSKIKSFLKSLETLFFIILLNKVLFHNIYEFAFENSIVKISQYFPVRFSMVITKFFAK